jgi:hypothetical protein
MRKWNVISLAVVTMLTAVACGKAHINFASSAASPVKASSTYIGDRYSETYQITFNMQNGEDAVELVAYISPNEIGTDSKYIGDNVYAVRVQCAPSGCSQFGALFNFGSRTSSSLSQFAQLYTQDAAGNVTLVKEIKNSNFNLVSDALNALLVN